MIYYFDFAIWFRLVRLAAQEPNSGARRSLLKLLLWAVPLRAAVHALCFFLDGILFPGLWRVKVKAPVFVIGHARSGTTLAHRLLCGDERFSAFKYYELLLPSLLQKKLVRLVAWLDRHLFGRRIERRLQDWEKRKFGPTQHIHKMGLTIPEEDDLIYQASCASGFWMTKLPYMGELDFFHIDQRPAASRRRMMRFYKECVRRQLYLNGGDRIHLSKNPTWCGRVESLIEAFPDARFVVLYRNPYETIPSLLKLLNVSWKLQGNMSAERIRESTRVMTDLSYETYLYPIEALKRHPDVPCAVIDYRRLTAAPKATIEQVYADLGLEMTPAYRAFLDAEEARAKRHETEHRYSLAEFGLSDQEIRQRLAPLFEQFHWDADTASLSAQESDHD
ncbi:sulfotransferase family protein [Denitratisoma sp. DHT3]|uniref:sulfotransferase family protein n=1 Tax=Denitratisoma sp. DHT3 TaxID=1981880 RepID=UPI001198438A|nr:sulfotransferase [Denitratisoma sp. DHT3]QDX82933.1 sulfotransferase family protein [Denitratisoma sp. DHT3]